MKGYVYVLTNEAMPGLVKIGRSKHAAGARAKQIYKGDTGVPLPFDVDFECLFDDCIEGEALVHEELQDYRINPNREFFRMEAWDARAAVMRVCAYEIDHTAVHGDLVVCEAHMYRIADKYELSPPEPYRIVEHLSDEAWKAAIGAYRERMGRIRAKLSAGVAFDDLGKEGDFSKPIIDCDGCGKSVADYAERSGMQLCEACFVEVSPA